MFVYDFIVYNMCFTSLFIVVEDGRMDLVMLMRDALGSGTLMYTFVF